MDTNFDKPNYFTIFPKHTGIYEIMVRADEFVYHSEEGWYNFKELGEFVARFHENDIAGFAIKDSVE